MSGGRETCIIIRKSIRKRLMCIFFSVSGRSLRIIFSRNGVVIHRYLHRKVSLRLSITNAAFYRNIA